MSKNLILIVAGGLLAAMSLYFASGMTPDFLAENKWIKLAFRGKAPPEAPQPAPWVRVLTLIATLGLGGGLMVLGAVSVEPTPGGPALQSVLPVVPPIAPGSATSTPTTERPGSPTISLPAAPQPPPTETLVPSNVKVPVPFGFQPRPPVPSEIDFSPEVGWQYGETFRVKTEEGQGARVRPYPLVNTSASSEVVIQLKEGDLFDVLSSVRWLVGGDYWWYVGVNLATETRYGWMREDIIKASEPMAGPRG
jgi:hypothetical protein